MLVNVMPDRVNRQNFLLQKCKYIICIGSTRISAAGPFELGEGVSKQSSPLILAGIETKSSKCLELLVVPPKDFQTFLRPCTVQCSAVEERGVFVGKAFASPATVCLESHNL